MLGEITTSSGPIGVKGDLVGVCHDVGEWSGNGEGAC